MCCTRGNKKMDALQSRPNQANIWRRLEVVFSPSPLFSPLKKKWSAYTRRVYSRRVVRTSRAGTEKERHDGCSSNSNHFQLRQTPPFIKLNGFLYSIFACFSFPSSPLTRIKKCNPFDRITSKSPAQKMYQSFIQTKRTALLLCSSGDYAMLYRVNPIHISIGKIYMLYRILYSNRSISSISDQ